MNAHDADAVCALVLDQQRECIEEPKEELRVSNAGLYVSNLHVQFYQVVMVVDAELSELCSVFNLLDLAVECLPLV